MSLQEFLGELLEHAPSLLPFATLLAHARFTVKGDFEAVRFAGLL
jgi:hypothetical protein